jgi:hypothetical protein
VLSGAGWALVAAALAAGVTGAWSPCGFSMVETLAPHGYAQRLRTSLVACATFTAGALAGGVMTFGGLALLGQALGAGGPAAATAAAVIALAAAAGEARGARIVPQIRRQVPESWRRVLPVPLAAGLYGVLLGLGFTTFILSFAVWALAAVSVALGEPVLGAAIGLAFGAGRALPVIVLAPAAGTERGAAAAAAMAERPAILRGLRVADAAALLGCALVLAASPASAADVVVRGGTDPSADGDALAWQQPRGAGLLVLPGAAAPAGLPGSHPALGGGRVAWIEPGRIVVADVATLAPVAVVPAADADAVAVTATRVAWRAAGVLYTSPLSDPTAVATVAPRRSERLGRPSLDGERLLFDVGGRRLEQVDLTTGARGVLREDRRGVQLTNPSATGGALLYVRETSRRQQLRLGALLQPGTDRTIYSTVPTGRFDRGYEPGRRERRHRKIKLPPQPRPGVHITLWSTALAPGAAYVTRLRQRAGRRPSALILRVAR